uniref:Uncharacterized protein n=1 Tax=Populus trichocarpa TaxID=3694 RepID=B9I1A9_POPTR
MLGFWMVMEAVVFGVVLRDGLEVTILADRATASARFWVINWLGCGDCALWRLGSGLFIWRWVSVVSCWLWEVVTVMGLRWNDGGWLLNVLVCKGLIRVQEAEGWLAREDG